ncbi:hypothetical protein PIB30_071420 [Stylosanthes scabra]|uniref:Uncharacterized protein n=1 Tax=Stylosanthes scabra TaxID=79078 RepID=A0ABU6QND0_9FABA|nr:hypothetical protein [Stylosanthes scabra]
MMLMYHHSNILDDIASSMKNFSLRVADLENWYNNIKSDITILQVAVLNNGDNQTVPKERSQEHVDKGKKVTEDNLPLEEDTDILLGGSDPEDTGTLVNAKKLCEINIIDLNEEIIAQSGNVNFTRTYLRTKAKKKQLELGIRRYRTKITSQVRILYRDERGVDQRLQKDPGYYREKLDVCFQLN